MGLVFRLVVGRVEIRASTFEAGFHDGEVLIGQGEVHHEVGLEGVKELAELVYVVSVNLCCLDVGATNGFDNVDGANYDLSLWVAYYNFLRPHRHAGYKVLNHVELLHGADNMPGKWQLLIFLGQQTILNMQHGEAANCS